MIEYKTKSEIAYQKIRQDIIVGKLPPGQKIVVSELSKEMRLSDIPIREAMKKLESEGFLEITPHVGAIASRINLDEIEFIYQIRMLLESFAVKMAAKKIKEKDILFLNTLIANMESVIERKEYEKVYAINKEFHTEIYRACNNPFLLKYIVELWDKVERIRSEFVLSPDLSKQSLVDHKTIIQALMRKNGALAATITRKHIRRFFLALVKYLKSSRGIRKKIELNIPA